MEFSSLFDYVYGEKAKPRPTAQDKAEKLSEDQKARIVAQKAMWQEKIKEEFSSILGNPDLSNRFRALLRNLNNTDLETLLYENTTDPLEAHDLGRDKDDRDKIDQEIKAKFKDLNARYGYFTDKQFPIFAALFRASKLTADFIERNNTPDNSVAYTHAYKIMALLDVNSKNPCLAMSNFIKLHATVRDAQPVHDLLIRPIPSYKDFLSKIDPKDATAYLTQWRALIKQHGRKALSLFQQSLEIYKKLSEDKKGFTLEDVETAASKIQYPDAERNPELAKLCLHYNISESIFNKCLTIQPKESDLLPDIIVHNDKYPEYYFVKLPLNDPRAYLLGEITNCCQSIGGHSEQCVKDGITLKNNGFYVLLKAKSSSKTTSPPIKEGEIDYSKYEIVGQSYAWLSQDGNLVLDSMENRTPSKDDAVAQTLLQDFSAQCFREKPSVGRICIGLGGRTPDDYKQSRAPYPESPKEGYQYADSKKQAIIAINPALLELEATLKLLFEKEFTINITPSLTSMGQAEWLHTFLTTDKLSHFRKILGEEIVLKWLKMMANNPHVFSSIKQLDEENNPVIQEKNFHHLIQLLSPISEQKIADALEIAKINPKIFQNISIEMLASQFKHAKKIINAMSALSQHELLTDSISNILISQPEHTDKLVNAFISLKQHPDLFTDPILNRLISQPEHAEKLVKAFITLKQHPDLFTDPILNMLTSQAEYADILVKAFISLKQHPDLFTDTILNMLTSQAAHADTLVDALIPLKQRPELLTDDIFNILLRNPSRFIIVASVIVVLHETEPSLINNENIDRVASTIADYSECDYFCSALESLSSSNMLNQTNFMSLLRVDKYEIANALGIIGKSINTPILRALLYDNLKAIRTARTIVALYKDNPALINEETLDLINKNARSLPNDIINLISNIASINPNVLNPEFLKLLYDKFNGKFPPNSQFVDTVFTLLVKHAPQLITIDLLTKCLDDIKTFKIILSFLSTNEPNGMTEDNIALLNSGIDDDFHFLAQIIKNILWDNKQLRNDPNTTQLLLNNLKASKEIYFKLKPLGATTITPQTLEQVIIAIIQPTSGPGKFGIFGESHPVDKPANAPDSQPPADYPGK